MQTTIEQKTLDVTLLEPRLKHPTIFQWFDAMLAGDSFIILNDHDPKPLYYQLLGERGNIFTWEYLEQGPQWWQVRIAKKSIAEKKETLGELTAKDFRKASVFSKYGLDFCCGGKKTVAEACAEKGIDTTKLEQELQQLDKQPATHSLPYNDWSLSFLVDYIINTHHAYVRKALPEIRQYADKVARVHGASHPELIIIAQLFTAVQNEMSAHMIKEEENVFPLIKTLEGKTSCSIAPKPALGFVLLEEEHEQVGKLMAEIRELSNDYTLPADACASYSLLFNLLRAFEEDLHLHVHLENNILFPKAIQKEKFV